MKGLETRLEGIEGVQETQFWIKDIATATGVAYIFGESNRHCFQ